MLDIPTKADGVDTLSATEFNSLNNELKNNIESTGQTLAGGDLFQMAKSSAAYAGSGTFYIDSGSTNSYVLAAIDSFKAIDAYTDGLLIRFIATTENTGAATVNVNSLGAKSIVTSSGVALPSGDIKLGDSITARFDVGSDDFLVQESFADVSANSGRNLIINGDFTIAQRGLSQTSSGYGSDDRWRNSNAGSTKVHTVETFTLGQTDVPNNPTFFSRTVVTTSAGAGNFVLKEHRIEDVQKTSGETLTLTFFAKADAAKDIAIEFLQNFGTGGSPSASVTAIGVTTLSLTTSFVKQTVTVTIPSVSGKTLGTNGDGYFAVDIFMDAGSAFDARTNSLGQQNGTFDISNVQLEFGTVATDFEFISPFDQLAECQRYFERLTASVSGAPLGSGFATSASAAKGIIEFSRKRAIAIVTSSANIAMTDTNGATLSSTVTTFSRESEYNCFVDLTASASNMAAKQGIIVLFQNLNDTLDIDAEL